MKVLIIANARYKGGLSGSDAIYDNFIKYWGCEYEVANMVEIDFKPFWICYAYRLLLGCVRVLFNFNHYDFVYSASDFLPDAVPGFIMCLKGHKWVAGYYLCAPKENWKYYYSQKISYWLIKKFADMVITANRVMFILFTGKKKSWINGGIDLSLAGLSNEPKIYDAVFCGRIHPSKGIDELIKIWGIVRNLKPDATLAIIGDGDLGKEYIAKELIDRYGGYNGVTLYGYMGDERFAIYKKSRIVLYPTPLKYQHFSFAPVEAMACGCPMIAFNLPVIEHFKEYEGLKGYAVVDDFKLDTFAYVVIDYLNGRYKDQVLNAYDWAQQWDYKGQVLRVLKDIKDGCEITG